MRVSNLYLENFRSFENKIAIELDQITVLIGPNNAGKSSILRALYLLQDGSGNYYDDVHNNASFADLTFQLQNVKGIPKWSGAADTENVTLDIRVSKQRNNAPEMYFLNKGNKFGVSQLPNIEPDHFIVPYLSKRKTATYQEDVREENTRKVSNDLKYLAAKVSRLSNPTFPLHQHYKSMCEAILGFMVTAISSNSGQRAGVYYSNGQVIFIDQMGEGVPNIVGLLVDLALSKNKLFLIEEPENDLHPKALKALLDLIIEKSEFNQFVVSTHSNIVVRHLAGAPHSKLYYIKATEELNLPPKATIRLVEPSAEARLEVLQELGYSLSDFDLWDGWLILEESSAERIIRDYLIPWFVPSLTRIRTLAAGGVNKVESTFEDFRRLVLFTHLEAVYRNAAWVRVDGDSSGIEIINKLRCCYSNWNPSNFDHFTEKEFERYYPAAFAAQIDATLAHNDKQTRQQAKKSLLNDVRTWLDDDENRGRKALELSAHEIIENLSSIEAQIIKKNK